MKIAVCVPVGTPFVTMEWAWSIRQLQVPNAEWFFSRSHEPIDQVRENMAEEALEIDPDYLFFLDQDTIPPANAVKVMLQYRQPVVSALYPDKSERWNAWVEKDGDIVNIKELMDPRGRLLTVDYTGFGCMLIDARVFERLSKPWFEYEYDRRKNPDGFSEDQYFCNKIQKELGFEVLLEGKILCRHRFTGALQSPKEITHLGV